MKQGEFVCIIGKVGAGKSSIIASLLGELVAVEDSIVERYADMDYNTENMKLLRETANSEGAVQISGSMALVQ